MPTNYTKAEIRFWWDPKDNAIHVTTRPGSTSKPLHTTFPTNEDSVRRHRSFFTWLVEMLKAEGKPVPPTLAVSPACAELPVILHGSMWWNDPTRPARLEEFVLRHDAVVFAVTDMEDRTCYRGVLQRIETGSNKFRGPLLFNGGTGEAFCELTSSQDGTYKLKGKWSQSTTPEVFDWNAELECGDQ